MLRCSQLLIGSLTGFSYLSSSWIVAGVVPGHTRIDASGAVVGDRSGRFVFLLVRFFGAPPCGAFSWVGDLAQALAVDTAVVECAESSEPSSGVEDAQGSQGQ